jgi:hypothetical protein
MITAPAVELSELSREELIEQLQEKDQQIAKARKALEVLRDTFTVDDYDAAASRTATN